MGCILKPTLADDYMSRLDEIINFGWQQLQEGELFYRILIERPDMLVFSGLYATFREQGYKHKKLEQELIKLHQTPGYFHIEMAAWRRLDLLAGYRALGLASEGDLRETFRQTWLHRVPSPWTITPSTAYGVTHTIFYMTDYGRQNLLDDQVCKYLRTALPMWFQYYVAEGNIDLAAEFLMCINFLGLSDPPTDSLDKFICAPTPDGSVPGPPGGPLDLLRDETDCRRIRFLKDYHTTIVYIVAMSRFVRARRSQNTG